MTSLSRPITLYRPLVTQAEWDEHVRGMVWVPKAPRWSICITTIPSRRTKLQHLLAALLPQIEPYEGDVEVMIHETEQMTAGQECTQFNSVGQKRNTMIAMSAAEYISFVDDDDMVSPRYVSKIMQAIDVMSPDAPDVITFDCNVFIRHKRDVVGIQNGRPLRCVFGAKFTKNYDGDDPDRGPQHERIPNQIPVWRKAIYLPFQESGKGEDTEWGIRMMRQGQQTPYSETYIPEVLYAYLHDMRDSVQYGTAGKIENPSVIESEIKALGLDLWSSP